MRRLLPLLTLLLPWMAAPAAGQGTAKEQSIALLGPRDTLLLTVEDGKKFIQHPVKPKQTLFSISKFYSLSLEDLYELNPALRYDPSLRTGTQLKIPIPNKAIKRYRKDAPLAKLIPINYVVQEGDNLFQICKRHFHMPVDTIVKRNRLKSNNIQPGQVIHMGWLGPEGIRPEWRPLKPATESTVLKDRFDTEKSKHREKEAQGVCFWQKDSKEKGDLYALHREAAIGTIIVVTNPIYSRTVYAKVIGRIPAGYERNVEVILSPEAARKIGAKDPRFFVKVKFLK